MDTSSPPRAATRPSIALTAAMFTVSAVLGAQALAWIAFPAASPFRVDSSAPIAAALGPSAAAVLELALGAAGMALAALHLAPPVRGGRVLAVVAAVLTISAGFGFLGFTSLAFAGYALVGIIPLAVLTALILLARRHPWAATGIAVVIVALTIVGQASGLFPIGDVAVRFASALKDGGIEAGSALSAIAFTGVWMLAATRGWGDGPLARAVLRRRVPLTIAAAACALPYVFSRLSWLTPWPLLGSPASFPADERAGVLVMGLALGTAMALGGILTLGLILPWGERFPRWMGLLGGAPIPVPLAVTPALVVAALFTFGGVGLAVDSLGGIAPLGEASWTIALVLPFWLWGPLLGLATWGYALHRRAAAG
ncbi:hypothetical protein E4V99_11750 [Microbacterium sp. dk485]|uniref:hypothetical protein n=1 Tax=Microbacterium sp. dk485 TaxID=2560021 RepID=UPI0010733431|nr:hypothetical protein [Microbacterium sp. dk485]TFV81649.1 hypothetical protein E4V99_11750 [Microbacterium sp. dk485]